MDRHHLDAFCRAHRLNAAAADAALALTGLRPDASAWRTFATTLLRGAGAGAVGAGVIFFVATNWQALGVLGRFALLQAALVGCIGVALWRPPPHRLGASALIGATLVTGALLALFGQSYQTGADVHELFFTWAALALPFALAGGSGAVWALWWGVVNAGLALLCGWLGTEHFVWRLLDGRGIDRSALLLLPCVVNLLGAALFVALRGTRLAPAAPAWLVQALTTTGLVYGTAAATLVVAHGASTPLPEKGATVLLVFAAICAAIGIASWLRKRDVYPMALLAAAGITVSTTWLASTLRFNDVGTFFMLALWLVASSTACGWCLLRWSRQWRTHASPNTPGALA
jgi:uncharacterized membrane protein